MLIKSKHLVPAIVRGPLLTSSIPVQRIIDVNTRGKKIVDPCDFKQPNNARDIRVCKTAISSPECAKAYADLPPCEIPVTCKIPCLDRRTKKKEALKHIKLKWMGGGTNFGTPTWELDCDCRKRQPVCPKKEPIPKIRLRVPPPLPKPRDSVHISILGAESNIGQYMAMLLKQCSCVKMLRLYEAERGANRCDRDLFRAVEDLLHIDTNCKVQAFTSECNELEKALQCGQIVVILGSSAAKACTPYHKRFQETSQMMVKYAESISKVCPKAFIIVCATPVDMNTTLIAEVLKNTGWYDPHKLFGSVAVPEMRATTLAARTLSLLPCYTKVPIVLGTEGGTLLPVFSKAIDYFDWSPQSLFSLTRAVRNAPVALGRNTDCGYREAELSEAHAITNLVRKIAHAALCHDLPRLYSYVDTNNNLDVALTKYMACEVELNAYGISKIFALPQMHDYEKVIADQSLIFLEERMAVLEDWYGRFLTTSETTANTIARTDFFKPQHLDHVHDCAYSTLC